MLWMLLISSIPFILLAGGIYGDYKATGYFPWQKEFDVKCFTSKNLEEICKYFLTQSVFSSIIRV